MAENKFPSEVIDLPSEGKLYSDGSPLREGKLEIKYMTAKEEDILTSQNLIKKGLVIEKLLDSLILTKGVKSEDLVIGDKNAVMVAARILAYGPEYKVEVTNPNTGNVLEHTFDLTSCEFKNISDDINGNEFEYELPISKVKVKFKLLTGHDEKSINAELESFRKLGKQIIPELSTRLKHTILSINGEYETKNIREFIDNYLLARDSRSLREEIKRIQPDIDLTFFPEGQDEEVSIPIGLNFFWPDY